MCTGFVFKNKLDTIYGFNLDIDPSVWSYKLYKTKNYFTIGIKVGSTVYFTHGVNKEGNFGVSPYMNGENYEVPINVKRFRIDLIVDQFIRNKYDYSFILDITKNNYIVNLPNISLHALVGDKSGNSMIIEPGLKNEEIKNNYAVISNFPIFANITDYSSIYYGKDRYDLIEKELKKRNNLTVNDALNLLNMVKQVGTWKTRISFVYSSNENKVYYLLNGDFNDIMIHEFI